MKHPKSYNSTPETRKRMSKVKLKGGKAETALAKVLWQRGYRYRRNDKRLPGSPDIAILKYQIAVLGLPRKQKISTIILMIQRKKIFMFPAV